MANVNKDAFEGIFSFFLSVSSVLTQTIKFS